MCDGLKVKEIVEANKDVFSLMKEKLVSEAFYVALHYKTNGTKYLRKARQELGFCSRGAKQFSPKMRGGYAGPQAATTTATAPQPQM